MGWTDGRYYYRSRKQGGRTVREYVGTGELARLAAQLDAINRQERRLKALTERDEKEDLAGLDAQMRGLCEAADLVARAALLAAGYRQHKRGEWRKTREQAGSLGG